MVLLVLSALLALAYLCFSVWISGGIPVSLSDTYYTLGKRGWVFQVSMALIALTLYPVWFGASGDDTQFLVFLACGSLWFVSLAPCFKMDLEGKVHYTSAAICCVAALAWQLLEGLWDVTLWFVLLSLMLSLQWKDKWMWWVEAAVIGSIFANLFRVV